MANGSAEAPDLKTKAVEYRARQNKRRSLAVKPLPTVPSEDEEQQLPVVKGAFNFETTTTKPLKEICEEIERALSKQDITVKRSKKAAMVYHCKVKKTKIQFDLEICRIEKLDGVKGLKFKRTVGDIWKYMEAYQEVCSHLKL